MSDTVLVMILRVTSTMYVLKTLSL